MRVSSRRFVPPAVWAAGTCVASAAVFVADRLAPPAVAVSALYPLIVLASVAAPTPPAVLSVAAVSTVLAAVDAVLTNRTTPDPELFLTLAVVVSVIWASAAMVLRAVAVVRAGASRSSKELEDIKYALDQSAIVATTDTRGTIKYVNDKFCEIAKYPREELLGQDHRLINSGHHPKAFIRDLWRTISAGRIWKGELRNRAKDGSIYWVDTTIVPFLDERGSPYQYMAIRYDITERKRSEELLREQAALTRLGEMAAVVAHEVKNPLAGIRGALQVISARMPEASRDRAVVGDIIARLDALNQMVQELLLFARPSTPKITPVMLGSLVEATALLLKRDPHFTHVDVQVEGGQESVAADPEMLQLVISNLLLNAAQAMNGHGRIAVSVVRRPDRVDVQFRDTGPGMTSDVRARMFEPFFTTKHRGTGLGLSTARRLVELHGGSMSADCPPDGGTVVTVSLPASDGDAAAQDARGRSAVAPS
jgi:PAS domain S-box-containing protein